MFAPAHHSTILDALPCNRPPEGAKNLKNEFDDAWVHFSHFGIAHDRGVLQNPGIWPLARGFLARRSLVSTS
jgi:hypothetical protein